MERYGEKDIARQDTGHNCIPNIVKRLKRRVIQGLGYVALKAMKCALLSENI